MPVFDAASGHSQLSFRKAPMTKESAPETRAARPREVPPRHMASTMMRPPSSG